MTEPGMSGGQICRICLRLRQGVRIRFAFNTAGLAGTLETFLTVSTRPEPHLFLILVPPAR